MSEQRFPAGVNGRSWSRWLWPALIASLALNLLVIGAVGGFMLGRGPERGISKGGGTFAYVRTLPRERRRELRRRTKKWRLELRPLRRVARQARREAAEQLGAEPFDRQAYGQARLRLFNALSNLHRAAQTLFVETAAIMTPEERRGFAAWRRRYNERKDRRWRDGGRNRDDDRQRPPPPK